MEGWADRWENHCLCWGFVRLASVRDCDTVRLMSGAAVEAGRVVEFWDEFARCILLDAPARK